MQWWKGGKWRKDETTEKPRAVETSTGVSAARGEGTGVGRALGSIQKSQKATKDGHGQVTFHFPSSSL